MPLSGLPERGFSCGLGNGWVRRYLGRCGALRIKKRATLADGPNADAGGGWLSANLADGKFQHFLGFFEIGLELECGIG